MVQVTWFLPREISNQRKGGDILQDGVGWKQITVLIRFDSSNGLLVHGYNLRLTDSGFFCDQKPLLPRASEWYMCGSMLHRTGKIWLLQHAILSWWLVVMMMMMMMIHINVMSSPGCHEFSSLFHSNCTLGCDVVFNKPHWMCTSVAKWNWIVTSNQFQLEINCLIKPLLLRVYGMIGMCISGVKLYIRPWLFYAVSTWEKDNGHVPCPL